MSYDQSRESVQAQVTGPGNVVRYHKRYALLLLAALFTVIGMFSVVIVWQDIRYERYDIERLRKHYDEYVNHVDNNFNRLWHEMLELQASAEADLSESRHSEIPMPYAYRFLKDEPDGQAFHLNDVVPPLVKEDIGNLTGDGSIKARSPDFYREIAMAFKLMVDFDTLADSIPNLVWSYYYSKDYFAVYYPWTPSVETRFEKESYKLTAWTRGLPENNPRREPYWTETYFDSVGKGLMVSCLAPIYDGDRFVGVVGSDLSVDFLNDFATAFESERGGVFVLYDQFDNFLAHPHLISASDKRISRLKEGLPESLSSQAERLKAISKGQIEEFNGWRAMRRPLKNAPYNALYMEPVPSRVESLIQRIGIGTIALSVALIFFLVTSLALTHMRFVRPSEKFVQHILLKSQGEDSDVGDQIPSVWQPWFSTITRVFDENAVLTLGMKARNRELQEEIKERYQAEEALKESERKYRTLFEESADGILITDIETKKFKYANPALCRLLGYSEEEIKSMGVLGVHPKDKLERVIAEFDAHAKGQKTLSENIPFLRKDGTIVYVDISGTTSVIDGRNCSIGFCRDITDKKHLEARLQQTHKMEAVGTLAGGIAHDFNNILASVIGFTELALDDAQKGTLQHENLQEVLIAGNRAKDLVQQILTFSRQADKEQKPVQVKLIVKEALRLLRASIPTTIEIEQNIQSNALVMGDSTQIHQILMNLCTNSAHAMEAKGGVLTVNLSDAELDSEFISDHPDLKPGPYINLTVADTGYGMPSAVLEKIFDPFFTTKEQGEGTGMGLSVVHGIVHGHGGTIYVYSEPGKGSSFKVFLPAFVKRLEPKDRIDRPIPTGTERILFIDDEPAIVNMGKQILESLGYDVITRTSSIEALEYFKAQSESVDLVITDMTMPKMTGEVLANELMRVRPDIPVILCTGFSFRMDEQKAKDMGIRALISKPILKREIAETIRVVLDG